MSRTTERREKVKEDKEKDLVLTCLGLHATGGGTTLSGQRLSVLIKSGLKKTIVFLPLSDA